MSLEERLLEDYRAAMKAGPSGARRKSTLSLARSALRYAQIDKGQPLTEAEVEDVLRRQAKQRRDSIEAYSKAGRSDLASSEQEELAILEEYLPRAMSAEEIAAVAREVIAATAASGLADIGKVMPEMMRRLKDKADGRAINQVVRQQLEQQSAS